MLDLSFSRLVSYIFTALLSLVIIRHRLRLHRLPALPLLSGGWPVVGHTLFALHHVRNHNNYESWVAQVMDRFSGKRIKMVQILSHRGMPL